MAITWTVSITNVDVSTGRATVTAIRTDSTDPDNPDVYTFRQTPIATTAQRIAVLDTLKARVEADALLADNVAAVVTDLETAAKQNRETWEGTR